MCAHGNTNACYTNFSQRQVSCRRHVMAANKFIAYYRVSTARQGRSGLGLDAQRQAVAEYLSGHGQLVAEVTEVESGKHNERPELAKALSLCRIHNAALIAAKIDRLSRNLHFITSLMESG